MTIHDVIISNYWRTKNFWESVAEKPDEPLVEATIRLTVSYNEYQALLNQNKPEALEPEVRP